MALSGSRAADPWCCWLSAATEANSNAEQVDGERTCRRSLPPTGETVVNDGEEAVGAVEMAAFWAIESTDSSGMGQ